MIKESEVFSIGKITRSRGLIGEVELDFTDDAFERGDIDYIVLSLDGILVPFFWEEYKFKNDHTLIIKLEDINDGEQAQKIIGSTVYYPLNALAEQGEETLSSLRALTGYKLINEKGSRLGKIVEVNDSSANVLLFVERPDKTELILPYHDDFLVSYDLSERILQMKFPEGLLDLNT